MSSSSHLAGSFLTLERRPRHGIARCLPTLILRFLGMSKIVPEYFLTPISGGVCVTLRDDYRTLGPIEVFTPFEELRSIRQKVSSSLYEGCISDSMFLQNRFNLDVLYKDFPEARNCISSDGRERRPVPSTNWLALATSASQMRQYASWGSRSRVISVPSSGYIANMSRTMVTLTSTKLSSQWLMGRVPWGKCYRHPLSENPSSGILNRFWVLALLTSVMRPKRFLSMLKRSSSVFCLAS